MSQIYRYTHKPAPIFSFAESEKFPEFLKKGITREEREGARFDPMEAFSASGITHDVRYPIIGMELEFELPTTEKIEEKIWNRMTQIGDIGAYLKTDSSIQNGLEIVTHPKSLKRWFEMRPQVEKLLDDLRADGYRSYQSGRCGLHFHISLSSFFNPLHAFRFLSFFMNNTTFCRKISGRNKTQYDTYCFGSKRNGDIRRFFVRHLDSYLPSARNSTFKKLKCRGSLVQLYMDTGRSELNISEHHAAANLTKNTVEIRIFRGTLNAEKIYSIMEFIESVRQFTAERSSFDESAIQYIEWIEGKKEYKLCKSVFLKKFFSSSAEKNNKHRKDISEKTAKKDVIDKKSVDKYIADRNNEEIKRLTKAISDCDYIVYSENFFEDRHLPHLVDYFCRETTRIATSEAAPLITVTLCNMFNNFEISNQLVLTAIRSITRTEVAMLHHHVIASTERFSKNNRSSRIQSDFSSWIVAVVGEWERTHGLEWGRATRTATIEQLIMIMEFFYRVTMVSYWLTEDLYGTYHNVIQGMRDEPFPLSTIIGNSPAYIIALLAEIPHADLRKESNRIIDELINLTQNGPVRGRLMITPITRRSTSTWILNHMINLFKYMLLKVSTEKARRISRSMNELLNRPPRAEWRRQLRVGEPEIRAEAIINADDLAAVINPARLA